MADEKNLGPKPHSWDYNGFHHVELWVSNASQAAAWYSARFGFKTIAYRGLETRSREVASYVLKQNKILFIISCPLNPKPESEMHRHIAKHGDGVRDVAFDVSDCRAAYAEAVKRGAVSVLEPTETKDEHGHVIIATVRTYGDTVHSLVERQHYKAEFLPGFAKWVHPEPLSDITPSPGLGFIDHCVGNQPCDQMVPIADFYERVFQFHRFWSVDDSMIHTEFSALRSIVMADWSEKVKMPINEPAPSKVKAVSQIQEYVDYWGGAGVQHIALNTPDIIHSVTQLRARGLRFLDVPSKYYEHLRAKLAKAPIKVTEDISVLQSLNILIDYDDKGYLLQIFTQPVEDRPTLFYEIIQRHNHFGFGAGNFKSLFESIEKEQARRGNLYTGVYADA